jgi:dTDP-4-dehydrorhamnose reductase
MHKILLFGAQGQLGWELRRALMPLGSVTALDIPHLDIRDQAALSQAVLACRPNVIVNATAYTAVDQAESEPEIAMAINGQAPRHLAELALKMGAALIHFSTDYVFDGTKGSPYVEDDPPNPLSVYAASKLAGEQAISQVGGAYLIVRTSWLYSLRRDSFVVKVLRWSRQQEVLRVVADQISNPTWARALAEAIAQVLAMGGHEVVDWLRERRGVYHLAGDGYASRLEWAQAILRLDPRAEEQRVRELQPALTSEFPTPAVRPLFSALDCTCFTNTFGLRLPAWEEALQLAMQEDCYNPLALK